MAEHKTVFVGIRFTPTEAARLSAAAAADDRSLSDYIRLALRRGPVTAAVDDRRDAIER